MAQNGDQNNELVLNPVQYAFVLDKTKGIINTLVGPTKQQIAPNTEQPIRFNRQTKKFEDCGLKEVVQESITADESSYLILEGTTKDNAPPPFGTVTTSQRVDAGRKVVIPGPLASLPLWPGQVATVVAGHHLKTNEYLICRVYNDEEANKNWSKAILRKRADSKEAVTLSLTPTDNSPKFVMGQLLIIKGTEVAFFIPVTGIDVLPQSAGGIDYVRSAVTLEKLDYCILLSESGHKNFISGPAVVFPEPTETFLTREENGKTIRKFKAYELTENMGLHIKVIEAYEDGDKDFKEGDELFITGASQPIYFPRKEHAIIRYGDQDVQFSAAIPAGEGRYVLNKKTGEVQLIKGPQMFLPDPRNQVIVRRVLTDKECELLFPGNTEALEFNREQLELQGGRHAAYSAVEAADANDESSEDLLEHFSNTGVKQLVASRASGFANRGVGGGQQIAGRAMMVDEMKRQIRFTPPRTITLNTKYDGAVTVNIWNGFAVLVVGSDGKRRVVQGPSKLLLQYDETLEPQSFSTGKPKSTDTLFRTVYLKYQNNQVSDVVPVTTKDLVKVQLKVSFRVNFEKQTEADPIKWFAVDNYVKFLCDRMRSMLNNAAMKHGIEEFISRAHDIVRDTVLGEKTADKPREGRLFQENMMRVFDVELLKVTVGDPEGGNAGQDIIQQLTQAQHATVTNMIRLKAKEAELESVQREEKIKQDIEFARQDTQDKITALKGQGVQKNLELDLTRQSATAKLEAEKLNIDLSKQKQMDQIQDAELARSRKETEQNLEYQHRSLDLELGRLDAETKAFKEKAIAVSDKMAVMIQAASDKAFASSIAQSTAPLAYLRNVSAADAFNSLIHGLPVVGELLGSHLQKVTTTQIEKTNN